MIKFINPSAEKPYIHFQSLYEEALANNQKGIEAISVSSYNQHMNEVEARYVNLKYIADNEWIFFSNYNSPKAQQFRSHSQVSVLIFWPSINIQIRIKAKISKTSADFSDEHFLGRTQEKNALAISSDQSSVISSYDLVTEKYKYAKFKNLSYFIIHHQFPYFVKFLLVDLLVDLITDFSFSLS